MLSLDKQLLQNWDLQPLTVWNLINQGWWADDALVYWLLALSNLSFNLSISFKYAIYSSSITPTPSTISHTHLIYCMELHFSYEDTMKTEFQSDAIWYEWYWTIFVLFLPRCDAMRDNFLRWWGFNHLTFRLRVQHLNHSATAPHTSCIDSFILTQNRPTGDMK